MRRTPLLLVLLAFACGSSKTTPPSRTTTPPVDTPPAGDGADAGSAAVPPDPTDGGSASVQPPAAPSLAGVTAGATVAGHVPLSAAVPAGTASVQFLLDGAALSTSSGAPFTAVWDTFPAGNGPHALSMVATDSSGNSTPSAAVAVTVANHIRNVFVIVMENTSWSSVKGSASAPYINQTLLAQGAHAEQYLNVPNLHPSLPNYLWLESGSNQGVTDDDVPANHRLATTQHLSTLLNNAGVSWKAYEEDIDGTSCPMTYVNKYAPKHDPFVYFTDVNGNAAYCTSHVRPYTELAGDLEADTVPAYSFITPNLCDDMHDCGIAAGDAWLAKEVPHILGSKAYREGGALFITWDESEGGNVPIGLIALSPLAKPGYSNTVSYTHSSTLRTIEEIFGVSPMLGGAATATDLSDLFQNL